MSRPQYQNISSPAAAESVPETIFASAALAASGAWTRSSIINVEKARKLVLYVDYDSADAGGYPGIIPLVTNTISSTAGATPGTVPVATDDVWFQLPMSDGTLTAGALTGTLPTGADYNLLMPQGVAIVAGLCVRFTAAAGATDEYRQAIVLDVTPYRWLHFIAAEVGDTANPGTLAVTYSLSA